MYTVYRNLVYCQFTSIVENLPPRLNGSAAFMVTTGQPSIYQFIANDSDAFDLQVLGGLSGSLTEEMGGMYTFTVNISTTSNITVSFIATDTLNASTLLNPQVSICACQNGNCTLEGVLNRDADPLIMNCICQEGMTVPLWIIDVETLQRCYIVVREAYP